MTHPKKATARKEGRREGGSGERKERGKEERKDSRKHGEMAGMTNNGSMEAQRNQAPVLLLLALQWCCWMCACLWGGAFTVNAQKKAHRRRQQIRKPAETPSTVMQSHNRLFYKSHGRCVFTDTLEMRAKGNVSVWDTPWQSSSSSAHQSMLHTTV